MTKLIVIFGITGNQGGSVADSFLQDPSWHIRAITRDPSKPAAQEWATHDRVELVQADQDDVDSLKTAFIGANAIFAMTDYWSPLQDPSVRTAAAKQGIGANEFCAKQETQRGKNMAIAAATPEVQKTLERFIFSSLPDVTKLTGGKHTHVWHFDSKAAVERFVRDDSTMVAAGLSQKSSFIHVGFYADNWRGLATELQRDPKSGGYQRVSYGDGNQKVPWVCARQDTGPLVKKLIENVKPGVRLLAHNTLASQREFLVMWSRILGTKLAGDGGIKRVPLEEIAAMLPGDEYFKEHLTDGFAYMDTFGFDGRDPELLHPKDINAQHLLTSLEEYIKSEDWSPIIGKVGS